MRTAITKLYRFSASHRLHLAALTEDENTRLYGKCNNPFGHGHDYVLEVTAKGPVDPETGFVLDVAKLDTLVENCVLRLFQHQNINLDVPQFQTLVPTTENIAQVIAGLLDENWGRFLPGGARLARVHVQETDRNGFEVWVPVRAGSINARSEELKVTV